MSMVRSEDFEDRNTAVKHIVRIRQQKKKSQAKVKTIRKFNPPQINFSATKISELTNLNECVTEPPVTMDLIDDDIEILRVHPLDLGDLLSNTQAVERNVKNVTAPRRKLLDKRNGMGTFSIWLIQGRKIRIQIRSKISSFSWKRE